jgi:hypothetical protein
MNKTPAKHVCTKVKDRRSDLGKSEFGNRNSKWLRAMRSPLLIAAMIAAMSGAAQAQNVYWDFAIASPTSGVPSGVSVGAVSQGNNNGTTTMLGTTSASSGYTGASGTTNAGAAARTGVLNTASSGSAYFEFTVTPNSGFSFSITSISFGSRSTSTGPVSFSLRSSADSYASDLTTGTLGTNNSTWTLRSSTGLSISRSAATTYRIYGFGGAGTASANTANWRIDDLTVTMTASGAETTPAAPTISSPSSVTTTGFTANWAASSGATKYYLDVATDSGFTSFVSGFNNLDAGNFTSYAVTGLTPATTYYYRVRANNSAGTSADSQSQVALTASLSAPGISVSPTSLTGLSYNGDGPSTAQSVSVTASNLTGVPGSLSVAGSANYEVSTTDATTGFGSSALISYTNATLDASNVWIRLKANLASGNYNAESISISGGGVATAATVSASGAVTKPVINLTTTNLGSFTGTNGTAGAPKTNTVTGTNLLGAITIVATNFFEVSGDAGVTYTTNLVLTPTAGVVSNAVLFRIAANAPVGSLGTNLVTLSSSQTTNRTVQVIGTVVNGGVTISIAGTNVATVAENGSPLTLDVTLNPAAPVGGATVTLTSTDADNSELDLSTNSLTFAEGETAKTVTLTPKADSIFDLDQPIIITATATNWTISSSVTVTVQNVDAEPVTYIPLASTNSNSYTQNFDGLGTVTVSNVFSPTSGVIRSIGAITSSNLNGWYGAKGSGSGTTLLNLAATNGNITSGGLYNFGTNTDRSLGTLASGSSIMRFGALIRNETGTNLNSVKLSLTGKFWKSPSTTTNTLVFAFGKVDQVNITPANFLTTTSSSPRVSLNFVSPAPLTGLALDGNTITNRVVDVAIPVALAPNEVMFVRWQDSDEGGNDAAIAIDDFSLTGSTEALTFDGEGTATLANTTSSSPYALSGIWPRGGSNQVVSATITPDFDTSTLTAVTVTVPVAFGTPTAGNVTPTGGATGGSVSVDGQIVTVTGTTITKVNPGVINIGGLLTPDTATLGAGDGIYSFAVSTAGVGGSPAPILTAPNANVLIPIANVRDLDANWSPADLGKIVAVEGVVTWSTIGGTYLQADGVGIGALGVLNVNPLVPGNRYAILGTVQQSSGLTRLSPSSLANVVNLGADVMPTPLTITLGKTAAEMEALEGVLIKVENLNRAAGSTNNWAAATTINAVDGSNNPIDIRIQTDSTATTEPGYPVTVTGVLGQFDTANPRDTGYQLMPRTMADLSFPPSLRLAWSGPNVINEDGNGYDPTLGFLTLTRLGADTSVALSVSLSGSPTGRLALGAAVLPQTVTFASGEATKTLEISPVNDSVPTGNTLISLTASASGFASSTISPFTIMEDDIVSDTAPPVITLNGDNPLTVLWGLTWIDGYSAFDVGDNAAVTVNRSNPVDTKVPGSYTVTYTAIDSKGNAATNTRIVNVRFAGGGTNRGPDGLPDSLRFAMGADGTNAIDRALLPTTQISGNSLVMNYHARPGSSPVDMVPVVSTELGNSNSWSTAGITVTTNGTTNANGVTLEKRQATVPITDGTRKFLRLRATTSQ